jgi:23S rRNA pseudouridine955/2504/2580 synthase
MRRSERFVLHHVTVLGDGMRLDRFLKKLYPTVPSSLLQKALRIKDVFVGGAKASPQHVLHEKECVAIYRGLTQGQGAVSKKRQDKIDAPFLAKVDGWVLHETADLLVVNKPAGVAVQGGTGQRVSLDRLVAVWLGKPVYVVHRLDKDTTGVLVFAKHVKAAAELSQMFRAQTACKVYWSLLSGPLPDTEGVYTSWLLKERKGAQENIQSFDRDVQGSKKAVTRYKVLAQNEAHSFVAFFPETGRMHQLRVHAKALSAPIWGDRRYGRRADGGLMLHARSLTFPQGPVLRAPLPSAFEASLRKVGLTPPEEGEE